MNVDDIEALMGVKLTEDQKVLYAGRLPFAIEYINEDCGGRFRDPDTQDITLPGGAKIGAAILVKAMLDNPGIASKTLADMSVSFVEGGPAASARMYWKPYRRVKYF